MKKQKQTAERRLLKEKEGGKFKSVLDVAMMLVAFTGKALPVIGKAIELYEKLKHLF